jgi:hypothetical protein
VLSPARVRQDVVTGLIMAASNGHAEVVRLLVEGKADINAANMVHTPLREAMRVKRREGGARMAGREKGGGSACHSVCACARSRALTCIYGRDPPCIARHGVASQLASRAPMSRPPASSAARRSPALSARVVAPHTPASLRRCTAMRACSRETKLARLTASRPCLLAG